MAAPTAAVGASPARAEADTCGAEVATESTVTLSAAMPAPSSIQAAARFSLSTNPIAAPMVTFSAGICGSVTPPSGSKVRPAIVKLRSRSRRKSLTASSAALGPGWASAEPNARVRLPVSVAPASTSRFAQRVDRAGHL